MRSCARLAASPICEASSKRQGDGQRFQKKAMTKTIIKNEAAAPANVRPSKSVSKSQPLPKLDFKLRHRNRHLSTKKLLALIETEAPQFAKLARVVGQWVWIRFQQKQPREVTSTLSQFGFHWNKRRQLWQHPCGVFYARPNNQQPANG
jgi:hypothetical protein